MEARKPERHWRQAGLTLVELLIGVAIGLLLITGATSLFLSNLDSSRRLLLEARLNQNIRSAAELITRDLRRAGSWAPAVATLGSHTTHPHQHLLSDTHRVTYSFTPPSGQSDFRFSLVDNRLRLSIGGGTAQDVTDPTMAKVTGFTISFSGSDLDIGTQNIPALPERVQCLVTRRYDISIEAEAPSDPSVKRQLQTSVRVRNDFVGLCP